MICDELHRRPAARRDTVRVMARIVLPLALLAMASCAAVPVRQPVAQEKPRASFSRVRVEQRRAILHAKHLDWEKEVMALRDVVQKEKGVLDDVSRRLDLLQQAIGQTRQHDAPPQM